MSDHSRLTGCLTVVAFIAAVTTPSAQSRPQAPAPTFRVESNYVEVAAYVTDGTGRFVGDLDVNAFEVLEDGKPQVVSTFARVELPIALQAAAPAPTTFSASSEEGTATNERQAEGRAFAILVDSLHVSPQSSFMTKRVLRQFITEHMGADDQAAIVHVSRPNLSQDFTSNKASLLASIDGVMGERLRSRVLTKWDETLRQSSSTRDKRASERTANARQSLDAMRRLVDYMAGMRGRRTAILYVSEGLDINLHDTIGAYPSKQMEQVGVASGGDLFDNSHLEAAYASAVVDDLRATMQTATRANVAIYTVDPRGLADPSEATIELVGTRGEGVGSGTPAETEIPTAALRRELYESQHFLRSIAEQTGGRAIVSTNNFRGGFDHIIRDSSAYYVLGYQAPRKTDGKFRRITVRAKRPGVNVWARKGYYPTRGGSPSTVAASASALDVLQASPMAIPGLRLRAASAVLPAATSGGTIRFAVEIDGRDLAFTERDGKFHDTVDLAYSVIDVEGNVVRRATKTLTLALTSATHAAVTARGLRYTADVALPAGRHQIRLAAIEANAQKTGSIFWDVTVPNFAKADLTMSPVAVGSTTTDQAPTINDAGAVPALMSGLMTATRTFGRDDTLSFAAIMWDSPPAADCSVTIRVIGETGTEVFRSTNPTLVSLTRGTGRFMARLPLASFESGHYQLVVEASSPSAKRSARQTVVFTVR